MDIKAEGLTDNQTKIVPSFKSDGCVCACVGCIRLNCGVVIMRKYESRQQVVAGASAWVLPNTNLPHDNYTTAFPRGRAQ